MQAANDIVPKPVGAVDAKYRPPKAHLEMVDGANYISAATAEERYQRLCVLRDRRIARARESFGAFMEYAFSDEHGKPFEQQWFHDDWSEGMDTSDRLLIVAPRDHGKTGQMVGRTIWELGRNPNLRVKIACAADGKAKERLFEVVQNITLNPRVREVFPNLHQADSGEWSKHKIIVARTARHRDASVEALGVTSTATGGRADLLIADDVVDRRNALAIPALREQIKQAWKSDWTNLLEPGSRIWYICTLWHKDDLSHLLMSNPAYRTMFYAVDDKFSALWPGKWSQEALIARYREINDSVEFNRAFRNQAVDLDSALVRAYWIKYSDLSKNEEFLRRAEELIYFTSYDVADEPTGLADQDYTASCTVAVDPGLRRIYVIDAWHDRLTLKEQCEKVFSEWKHYRPARVFIEKAGLSTLAEWTLDSHPEMKGSIEIVRPRISKALRLMSETPLLEGGQVVFSHHLDPDSESWNPGRGSLPNELTDFPFGKHDDMVDAFTQVLAAARKYALDTDAQTRYHVEQEQKAKRKYKI